MANMKISELPYLSSLPCDAVMPAVYNGKVYKVSASALTGTDTSDADATAGDIRKGQTSYVNGEKVTGDSEAIQATPTISVSSAGKITASCTQAAGFVDAGTKSTTRQLTTYAGTTVNSNGKLYTNGKYCTGDITVNVPTGGSVNGVEIGENTPSSWSIPYPSAFAAFCVEGSTAYFVVALWDNTQWVAMAYNSSTGEIITQYGVSITTIPGGNAGITGINIYGLNLQIVKWAVLGP